MLIEAIDTLEMTMLYNMVTFKIQPDLTECLIMSHLAICLLNDPSPLSSPRLAEHITNDLMTTRRPPLSIYMSTESVLKKELAK